MYYLETGSTDPCYNLAFEEYILLNKTAGEWLILWQNSRAVIIGLNQNAAEEVELCYAREHGVKVVRRITGGGAVYHDLGNLNYSFITDSEGDIGRNMKRFNRQLCSALASLGVPAKSSGRNDILAQGQKISGVAERIHKERVLHHGTLLFDSDVNTIAAVLNADSSKFASKSVKSVRGRVGNIRSFMKRNMDVGAFWGCIKEELGRSGLEEATLSAEDIRQIKALAETKYSSWDWTWGRAPRFSYTNQKRFAGGSLKVCLDIEGSRIKDAAFFGDFLALTDCDGAVDALRGCRLDYASVRQALDKVDVASMFGTIKREEILSLFFDDGDKSHG